MAAWQEGRAHGLRVSMKSGLGDRNNLDPNNMNPKHGFDLSQ